MHMNTGTIGMSHGALYGEREKDMVRMATLLNITPARTRQSSREPPGIFSVLMYFLMSMSICPPLWLGTATHRTASSAKSC